MLIIIYLQLRYDHPDGRRNSKDIELKVVTEVITDRDAEDDDALDSGHPGTETKGNTTPSIHSDNRVAQS